MKAQGQRSNQVHSGNCQQVSIIKGRVFRKERDDLAEATSPRPGYLPRAFEFYLESQVSQGEKAYDQTMRSTFYKDHYGSNLENRRQSSRMIRRRQSSRGQRVAKV